MLLVLKLTYNVIRILWAKLKYGSRYHSSWIERIHHSADIRLYGHSSISIGRNVEISKDAELWCFDDARLSIGNGCYFNNRLMVSCHSGLTIGNGCLFGPDVKIFDNNHMFTAEYGVSPMLKAAPVKIGNHCWIASNVIIMKGSVIGDNCVIGAGCIVNGKIPSGHILKVSSNNMVCEEIRH